MANFEQLKATVANVIKTNGEENITGAIMQDVLLTIINSIAGGYMFGGVARHSGNVGNPDYNVFYLAGSGAYTGYGGAITIPDGCYGVFLYDGTWSQEVVDIGVHLTGDVETGEQDGVTGGRIKQALDDLEDNINMAINELASAIRQTFESLLVSDVTAVADKLVKITEGIRITAGGQIVNISTFDILAATAEKAGLMSAADKQMLDGLFDKIRTLSISDTTPQGDEGVKVVESLSATLGDTAEVISTFTILAATASKAGLMSAADKTALDTLPSLINAGYLYAGIATPSTVPSSTSAKIFYIAIEGGTYTNFGNLNVTQGINILYKSGDAWSVAQVVGIDNEPTVGSDNLVKSGGVQNELALGAVYDVSAKNPTAGPNNDGKFESLAALLSDDNLNTLIPTAVRKGGMSIKFVQSSDNTYVQFRLMADEWSTNTDDWSFCGNDVLTENSEFVKIVTDKDDKILYGIKANGDFYFGAGCPKQVRDALEPKVDKEKGKSLIDADFASMQSFVGIQEWLQVIIDKDEKIIEGTKKNKKVINLPLDCPTLDEIRASIPKSKWYGKTAVTLGDSHSQRRDEWMPKLCEMLGMEFLESLNSQIPVGNVTPPAYEMYINPLIAQVAALISKKNEAIPDVIFIENVHYFYNDRPSAFPLKPSSMELVGEYNMTKAEEIAYFSEHFSEIVSSVQDKEPRKIIKTVINGKTCTVTFSASSISSGTFVITLDGATISTELTAGMTVAQAVSNIMEWQFGEYTDWVNVSKTDNSITFRYNGEGQAAFNFSYNAGGTGLSASAGNITDISESIYRYYASNTMDDWNTESKWIRVVDWYQGYMQNKGVMELLQENFPESIIVVLGIPNWRMTQSDFDDLDYYEFTHTESFLLSQSRKEEFLECGKMYDCKTVDVEKLSGISPINYLTFYNPNEVHPKPIGYNRWAEIIAKELC